MVSEFDGIVLVQKIFIMCYILLAIDIPIVTYSVVTLLKPKIIFLGRSCRMMNLSVNCLFPNQNVMSHWPTGPKLAPLADMTLCVCTFNNWGVWGNDLKNFSKTTDIFAPVSSSVAVIMFWIVIW